MVRWWLPEVFSTGVVGSIPNLLAFALWDCAQRDQRLIQKDSNKKVTRDKAIATIKSVAFFGFFFSAMRSTR